MRVLKIELLLSEMNTILAKTFINFLSLGKFWTGESSEVNLGLFCSNFVLNTINFAIINGMNNKKMIGEIKVELKI